MGHVTDPGEEQNETLSCCCAVTFSGASKRLAIFPHPHMTYQQLKFCVQLFLGGPFNMSKISDEVSI
jgi:hypothetical protein